MPHKQKTRKPVTREVMVQAWIGSFGGFLFFAVIGPAFLWGWESWWTYFVAAMILIGPISTSLYYVTQEQIKCPYCHERLNSKSKVCPECGLEIFRTCPECHKDLDWGHRYCKKCGAKLKSHAKKAKKAADGDSYVKPEKPKGAFCPTCGERKETGAKFCARCGVELQ